MNDDKPKIKFCAYSPQFEPRRAYEHAAGFDLGIRDVDCSVSPKFVIASLGVRVVIPVGYVGLLFVRSGYPQLQLTNEVGVIDPDYRGEIKAKIHNMPGMAWTLTEIHKENIRPFQLVIVRNLTDSENLSGDEYDRFVELYATARGEGGFGSSDQVKVEQ